MSLFYDLLFLIIGIFYLPGYLFRRKFHRGFLWRLGLLPRGLDLSGPIWLHAVSVGEAMAIRQLVKGLRKDYPEKRLVISTVTPTGNKIAKEIAGEKDLVTYLPFDFGFIIRRVINKVTPSLFIIAETEIWPNIISYLFRKNIPVVVVNGRISRRSFKGYSLIKFLVKTVLNKVTLFCVQTRRDAQRLTRLGVLEGKIRITGNMKFDLDAAGLKPDLPELGLSDEQQLLVCGSTHEGEEEIILDVYRELQRDFPRLKLLIAPRQPQRALAVGRLAEGFGFKPITTSLLAEKAEREMPPTTIYILDKVGFLLSFYGICDIAFVGGSLIKKGGHNILEPASFGKPIIFGPYMFNFQDIAELFLDNKAAILVRHKQELKTAIKKLLLNKPLVLQMSQRAKDLIAENAGATQKNLRLIKEISKRP